MHAPQPWHAPPDMHAPPPDGQCAGGTHPTGMHTCLYCYYFCVQDGEDGSDGEADSCSEISDLSGMSSEGWRPVSGELHLIVTSH